MIFISHLQPLQISNKAKFHPFFETFSHWKLKPAPTQDKFLDFLQTEFSHSKCLQKDLSRHVNLPLAQKIPPKFTWMGGKRFALASAQMVTHPHLSAKKAFWKDFEYEDSFCKKSRNLSWVEAGFSKKWAKSQVGLISKFQNLTSDFAHFHWTLRLQRPLKTFYSSKLYMWRSVGRWDTFCSKKKW